MVLQQQDDGGQPTHVLCEITHGEEFAKMNKLTWMITLLSEIQTKVTPRVKPVSGGQSGRDSGMGLRLNGMPSDGGATVQRTHESVYTLDPTYCKAALW
jgi:hypothetical protein